MISGTTTGLVHRYVVGISRGVSINRVSEMQKSKCLFNFKMRINDQLAYVWNSLAKFEFLYL